MVNRNLLEREALRSALGPGKECPTIEELASCVSAEAPAEITLTRHVLACAYCKAELYLMGKFFADEKGDAPQDASEAARLLRGRSKEIFRQVFPAQAKVPWWKAPFSARRLAQASLAFAAILLVVGTIVFVRSSIHRPELVAKGQESREVYRSGSFALISPAGDLQQRPREIRWESVANAASYQARVLEVDHSELWNAKTTEEHIELPAAVRARMVPAKTLFVEITAFDSSGKQVGATGPVRFRLVQK